MDWTKIPRLFEQYALGKTGADPSPAAFWYLPEIARLEVRDCIDRLTVAGQPTPFYPIDFTSKISYPLLHPDAPIPLLNYGGNIGRAVNPEAVFQYLLGVHDSALSSGSLAQRDLFLSGAEFMRARQAATGEFWYDFNWYECHAPWASFLGQSRGASVMLRAWKISGDSSFREAAAAAVARADVPVEEGGFLATHPVAGCKYYEEYPATANAVFNGYLSSLFGLWEAATIGESEVDAHRFSNGISTVCKILPAYLLGWWSIYDLSGSTRFPNVHSPRYHRLVGYYLRTLAVLSQDARILAAWHDWHALDVWPNRSAAVAVKAARKILYR